MRTEVRGGEGVEGRKEGQVMYTQVINKQVTNVSRRVRGKDEKGDDGKLEVERIRRKKGRSTLV